VKAEAATNLRWQPIAPSERSNVMQAIRTWTLRRPVAAYFVVTLALTWAAFVPFYLSNGDSIPWFTFGPLAAALVVAALSGGWLSAKAVLAPMVKWRVGAGWYVVSVGLPVAIQLASILANPGLGSAAPSWNNIPPLAEMLPMVALFTVFSGPLGEEPGWRGFATAKLLSRRSAASTSVIVGCVWALWHLPLALVGDLTVYGTVNVFAAAFVFTWLYQNTGSVLLAILMHAAHQNSVRYLGKVFVDGDHLQQQWIAVGLSAVVAAAIVGWYGARSFVARPSIAERPLVPA
jgi:uncharacterized protein